MSKEGQTTKNGEQGGEGRINMTFQCFQLLKITFLFISLTLNEKKTS